MPWFNPQSPEEIQGQDSPADRLQGGKERSGCINSVVPSTGTWHLASTPRRASRGRSPPGRHLLEACEATIQRLVTDRRYFARPAKTLFTEVREHFALAEQVRVYMVIEHHIERIEEFLDSLPDDVTLDGQERNCLASTRKGTPCQREPLPGMDYCPSHKHLEETLRGARGRSGSCVALAEYESG